MNYDDVDNVMQGVLIRKALIRTANKENAWTPEEQAAFQNQVMHSSELSNWLAMI